VNLSPQLERNTDRRHRVIREAAIAMFLAKGYDGATMEDIAIQAGVSKQTVYKHFKDKQHLYADIVLSTTDNMNDLVGHISERLTRTDSVLEDLEYLAVSFLTALMQTDVLRLRRLVISSVDRFPEVASTWYEQGFERALAALATCFQVLTDRRLLSVRDPMLAAEHFVGMLFWIPINKAMFTGDDNYADSHDLVPIAHAAAQAFMHAYGRPPKRPPTAHS
jgi:TetR/AcrR family transcriptional repressor of mexJK operon